MVWGGGHLRDVGWVAKSYQVAEERGSTTECQVQGHQPDDTWRHEKGSGLGGMRGTQAQQPPTPPQGLACSRQALEKNITSKGWACALAGCCLPSGITEQPPNFVPFLLPSLQQGLPPSCTPADGVSLHRGSAKAPIPVRARSPLFCRADTPSRCRAPPGLSVDWGPPPLCPRDQPLGASPAHGPGDTAVTDTSASFPLLGRSATWPQAQANRPPSSGRPEKGRSPALGLSRGQFGPQGCARPCWSQTSPSPNPLPARFPSAGTAAAPGPGEQRGPAAAHTHRGRCRSGSRRSWPRAWPRPRSCSSSRAGTGRTSVSWPQTWRGPSCHRTGLLLIRAAAERGDGRGRRRLRVRPARPPPRPARPAPPPVPPPARCAASATPGAASGPVHPPAAARWRDLQRLLAERSPSATVLVL